MKHIVAIPRLNIKSIILNLRFFRYFLAHYNLIYMNETIIISIEKKIVKLKYLTANCFC